MKRTLIITALMIGLINSGFAQSGPEIAVVNMSRLLGNYHKAQKDLQDFQVSVENANREIEIMRQELEELLEPVPELREKVETAQTIMGGGENMTPRSDEAVIASGEEALAQLNSINQEFESRRERLLEYQKTTDENLSERRNSIVNRHLMFIRGVVSDYAEANNYDLVINETQGVIYSKDSMGITDAVLKILNADAPSEG